MEISILISPAFISCFGILAASRRRAVRLRPRSFGTYANVHAITPLSFMLLLVRDRDCSRAPEASIEPREPASSDEVMESAEFLQDGRFNGRGFDALRHDASSASHQNRHKIVSKYARHSGFSRSRAIPRCFNMPPPRGAYRI